MGSKRKSKKLLNESESTSKYRKGENIASKDFCLRFPEIAESIFDNLGNKNLVKFTNSNPPKKLSPVLIR